MQSSSGATAGATRRRPWALYVAAVLGAAFVVISCRHFWQVFLPIYRNSGVGSRSDFWWFYYAMQVAWLHLDPARRLYDLASEHAFMRSIGFAYDPADLYGYPPPFALMWAPLAALSPDAARQVWSLIGLGALLAAAVLAGRHAAPESGAGRLLAWPLAGVALWSQGAVDNAFWGQPDSIVLLLVAAAVVCATVRRPSRGLAIAAGIAAGLATVWKVTPGILLAYFALRWLFSRASVRGQTAGLAALSGAATIALSAVASGAVLGWSTLPQYVFRVLPAVEASAWAHGPAPWNQAVHGFLMLWSGNQAALGRESTLAAAVFLGVAVWAGVRRHLDGRVEAALASLLVLLAAPSLENHHFAVEILPWVLLLGWAADRLLGAGAEMRAWPAWVAAAPLLLASWTVVAPSTLRWPPPFLVSAPWIAVPAGHYDRAYVLGAASFGPVSFTLRTRYAGGPSGSAVTVWPDWWSPGNPLPAAIAGDAVHAGRIAANVGLYAFDYPLRGAATLTALVLPATLPQQNGGQEMLHIVALTLEHTDAGGWVKVPLQYNADGIAAAMAGAPGGTSFDGYGYDFWSPSWPGARVAIAMGGRNVPFALPAPGAAANVLNDPRVVGGTAGAGGVLSALVDDAPRLLGLLALFAVALMAVFEPLPVPFGRPSPRTRPRQSDP